MEKLGLEPKQKDRESGEMMLENIEKIVADMGSSDNVAKPMEAEAEIRDMSIGAADDYVEMSQNE